ncbi:MAG: glycosyltransferase [Candidatus Sericytochromatia bacterium]
MKIVFNVFGTRGDVAPAVATGAELARRGHEVIVCGPPGSENLAVGQPISYRVTGQGVASLTAVAEGRIGYRQVQGELLGFLEREAVTALPVLRESAHDADLIVGGGVPLMAASIAEALSVPYRFMACSPLVLPSRQWPPLMLPVRVPRWSYGLAWLGSGLSSGLLAQAPNRARGRLGLAPIRDFWTHIYGLAEKPILAADPPLLKLPSQAEASFRISGAALLQAESVLSPELEAFLAAGPAPVYIGFGSMGGPQLPYAEILALHARLGQLVLLMAPPAASQGLELPEGMMLIGAEPHHLLFPRCLLAFHHGGASTVATAARAGIPQIIAGFGGDQFYWGGCLAALGVGPDPLYARQITPQALALALAVALARRTQQQSRQLATRLVGIDGAALTADLLESGI